MAPELTEAEADVDFDNEETETPESPPNLTKATDVFAFSMVALEVSDLACVRGFACCSRSYSPALRVVFSMIQSNFLITHRFSDLDRKTAVFLLAPRHRRHRSSTGWQTT